MKNLYLVMFSLAGAIGSLVFLPNHYSIIFIAVYIILIVLAIRLAKNTDNLTVEKYINRQNKKMGLILQNIHNSILEILPNVEYRIDKILIFPHYFYKGFPIIAFQKMIGGKSICIYPQSGKIFFSAFENIIKKYKINNHGEIILPTDKSIDYMLIKDIVKFNIQTIEESFKYEI